MSINELFNMYNFVKEQEKIAYDDYIFFKNKGKDQELIDIYERYVNKYRNHRISLELMIEKKINNFLGEDN